MAIGIGAQHESFFVREDVLQNLLGTDSLIGKGNNAEK